MSKIPLKNKNSWNAVHSRQSKNVKMSWNAQNTITKVRHTHSNAGVSQRSVADRRAGMVSAIIGGSDDGRPTDKHRSCSTCFQRRGSINLELFTFCYSTV